MAQIQATLCLHNWSSRPAFRPNVCHYTTTYVVVLAAATFAADDGGVGRLPAGQIGALVLSVYARVCLRDWVYYICLKSHPGSVAFLSRNLYRRLNDYVLYCHLYVDMSVYLVIRKPQMHAHKYTRRELVGWWPE